MARFVNKVAVTNEGEKAKIHYYLDTDVSGDKTLLYFVYAYKSATPFAIYRDYGTFLTNQLSKMRLYISISQYIFY